MSYGLYVENEQDDLLINSQYKNYCFDNYYRLSSFENVNLSSISQGFITVSSKKAFIAFQSNRFACLISQYEISGGQYQYWFYIAGSRSGAYIDIYTFTDPEDAQFSGEYGLQVFDDASSSVFDSRLPYMNVEDFKSQNASNFNVFDNNQGDPEYTRYTYSPSDVAVVQCYCASMSYEQAVNVGPNPSYSLIYHYSGVRCFNNIVDFSRVIGVSNSYSTPTNQSSRGYPYCSHLVVDISRFHQGVIT